MIRSCRFSPERRPIIKIVNLPSRLRCARHLRGTKRVRNTVGDDPQLRAVAMALQLPGDKSAGTVDMVEPVVKHLVEPPVQEIIHAPVFAQKMLEVIFSGCT